MSVSSRTRRVIRDDAGMTLPEVIIVSLITTLVLIAVGGMYISTVRTERVISNLTGSTSSAQLIARSIDAGVRNGVLVRPITSGGDGGQLLLVCSASADPTVNVDDVDDLEYRWRAWYYSPHGDGEIRERTFASDAAPVAPTLDELDEWTLLLSGVTPRIGDDEVFAVDTDARLVTVDFSALSPAQVGGEAVNSATIQFDTTLAPLPAPAAGSEPCT